MSAPDLAQARELLRSNFGFSDFLPGQAEVVAAVLSGRDALAVMPTGSGKSLLYQLPALSRPGLVVVVSPLIALMRDQLRGLEHVGAPAVALHSAQDDAESAGAIEALSSGRARLLYVAPERLAQEGTQDLLRKNRIKLFAVDEAHCVSHWGHEFRPDYRALGEIARKLGSPPVLAVTATAGPRTRADIADSLFARAPQIFLRSFSRDNLALSFARRRAPIRQILDFAGRAKESGIVYCNSRNRADGLARDLARLGVDALPYHAGLDAFTRGAHQDAFFARKGVVMVATIAFGMGVDKADVRFIVHVDLPTSVEGYYQEIGRAGRDGAPARALGLFSPAELALRWRVAADGRDDIAAGEDLRRQAMARLAATPSCRFQTLLAEFGEASAPCGRCDHCGALGWPRRAEAALYGWRAMLASRLAHVASGEAVEDDAPLAQDSAPQEPQTQAPTFRPPALSVADARLLRALEAQRSALARAKNLPPRRIASDETLRALAQGRPQRADDPLFADVGEKETFLRIVVAAE